MNKGRVYIVGAGPGDPGLLTVKAVQILKISEVVIYDQLVHPGFFALVPADSLLIYAGKQYGKRSITQTQINEFMVKYASSQKIVCRLKGGDPAIFGRLTEELKALKTKKIPYEIIPGITAASGASAYTGTPLTDRTLASSVAFVTAHKANSEKKLNSSLPQLIKSADTTVVYMGTADFKSMRKSLLKSGVPKTKDVTAVMWATWGIQKKSMSCVERMDADFTADKISGPAVLIFGKVNRLSDEFRWFEYKPLFGKRFIITRSLSRNRQFIDGMISDGADVIELPTIHIKNPDSFKDLDSKISSVAKYGWIVFTSANSASSFLNRLIKNHTYDMRILSGVKIASIGKSTTQALKVFGLKPDLMPEDYTGKSLALEMKKHSSKKTNLKALLIRSDIALTGINEYLREEGFSVDQVTGYKTVSKPGEIRLKFQRMLRHPVHGIIFTSSSTVHNFIKAVGIKKSRDFLSKTDIFSIGPVTSRTLESYDLANMYEAKEHTMSGIASSIRNVYAKDHV